MPRIPYPDPATLPADIRDRLDGFAANVTRMLPAASLGVYRGFSAFSRALFAPDGSISPQIREIAILRVGYLSNAAYETFQHEAFARHVGMTDAQIEAIRKGGPESAAQLGEAGAAVIAYTDDLVLNVRPSDATLSAVRRLLGDQAAIDLIFVIGAYMTVSRFLETTGVEIDDKPIDWVAFDPGRPAAAAAS